MTTFVFVTVFLSPHTLPFVISLCDYYDSVVVIELGNLTLERKKMGYDISTKKISVIKYFDQVAHAQKLINECDEVIFASYRFDLLKERIRMNKRCWIASERIFKKSILKWIDPRTWKIKFFCKKNLNRPVYLLAIGRCAALDFIKLGFNRKKIYLFGYFPEDVSYGANSRKTHCNKIKILWVGRFIYWKKPFKAISVVKKLPSNFVLKMIGDGKLFKKAQKKSKNCDRITFLGNVSNNRVREEMRDSDLLLSLSGRKEGWGAVINEAMMAGCPVVCSDAIGCFGTLANENNVSSFHRNKDIFDAIFKAISKKDDLIYLSKKTISEEYNCKLAAKRFVDSLNNIDNSIFATGVMSKFIYE